MNELQEAPDASGKAAGARRRPAGLATTSILAAALAAGLLALAGCTALKEETQSPEQAAAEQPNKVSTAGAKEEFPNLAEVPNPPQT
jgi:hypothetical protein